jgi:flagellar hook-associated protein FlgK
MKKALLVVLLVSTFAARSPLFSQEDRYNGLKTKIDDASARYHQVLDTASVDFRSAENRQKYDAFNKRYNALVGRLHTESAILERRAKVSRVTPEEIQERRSSIEALVNELDALKSEYDSWIRTLG